MPKLSFSKNCITVSILCLIVLFSADIFGQTKSISGCSEKVDYDSQIAEANKEIKYSAYNIEAYLERAAAYLGKNEYDRGLLDAQKVIELNPNESRAYHLRGTIYSVRANYDLTIKNFALTLNLDSKNKFAYYGRGRAYHALQQYNLAIDDYSQAIRLDEKYLDALWARGAVYSLTGDRRDAYYDWNKATEIITDNLKLDPKNVCNYDLYLNRGLLQTSQANYEKAILDYNQSIELKGDNYLAFHYRGQLYLYFKKDYRKAFDDFKRSVELSPNFADNYNLRSLVYDKLGDKEKAEADRKVYQELSQKL